MNKVDVLNNCKLSIFEPIIQTVDKQYLMGNTIKEVSRELFKLMVSDLTNIK